MGKQVFILNCPTGNAGVAKIIKNGKSSNLTINLNKKIPEIKKCHLLNGDKIIQSFDVWRNKRSFDFSGDLTVENIYLTSEKTDNILAWTGEIPHKSESDNKTEDFPDIFSFDNFFGGGFEWRRIRGNFIMHNYSIIHYVISDTAVYQAINRAGYYSCGVKKDEDITFIAIAIPNKNGANPFVNLNTDSYTIMLGKTVFSAICIGIDKTGEFFITI